MCYDISRNFELRAFPRDRSNVTKTMGKHGNWKSRMKIKKSVKQESQGRYNLLYFLAFHPHHLSFNPPGFSPRFNKFLKYGDQELFAQLPALRLNKVEELNLIKLRDNIFDPQVS